MSEVINNNIPSESSRPGNGWDALSGEIPFLGNEESLIDDEPAAESIVIEDDQDHETVKNIEIYNLTPQDNLEQAAEAIYLTDQYICPDLFGDEERAKVLVGALFSEDPDVMFSYSKTLVAKDKDNNIAGILVYRDSNCQPWDADAAKARYVATGIEMPQNFDRVNNIYMPKTTGEMAPGAAEIEFVGVRDDFLSQGIGKQLTQSLASKPEYTELHLDVLDSHPWARKSYGNLGFEPDGEKFGNYPDASEGVQHMVLRKESNPHE